MIGEPESERCYFCGGKLKPSTTTLPFVVGSKVIVIKNAPAEVCGQCNEPILKSEVAEVVDRLLKDVQRSGFEVSVVSYEQLTPMPV